MLWVAGSTTAVLIHHSRTAPGTPGNSGSGVTPAKVSQVQLTEAILEMVKAGLGVSMMARWAVKEQVEAGQLVARPLTSKGLYRQWSAALLKNTYAPPYMNEFIELVSRPAMPKAYFRS